MIYISVTNPIKTQFEIPQIRKCDHVISSFMYTQCSKWAGLCPYTITELIFIPEFYTGTYQYILYPCIFFGSRVSSVSIVSDYGLDNRAIGVRSPAGAKDFSSNQTGSVAHPASCTMGTGGPLPGGKARPGRDADHSLPSIAEVVNE
jgi:hypothetical protein